MKIYAAVPRRKRGMHTGTDIIQTAGGIVRNGGAAAVCISAVSAVFAGMLAGMRETERGKDRKYAAARLFFGICAAVFAAAVIFTAAADIAGKKTEVYVLTGYGTEESDGTVYLTADAERDGYRYACAFTVRNCDTGGPAYAGQAEVPYRISAEAAGRYMKKQKHAYSSGECDTVPYVRPLSEYRGREKPAAGTEGIVTAERGGLTEAYLGEKLWQEYRKTGSAAYGRGN